MKKEKNEYRMTDYANDMCYEYFMALKERRKFMKNFLLGGLALYSVGLSYLLYKRGEFNVRSR